MNQVLPNLIKTDLKILFVGINPGLRSAAIGHHFAGHSNRFWRFLFDSGLTPSKLRGEEDVKLLDLGYGITNIVARPSTAAAELTPEEFRQGAIILLQLISDIRPRIVACLGKDIYRYLSGKTKSDWGKQNPPVMEGVIDFILPNPSGLNRMPIPEQLEYYLELKRLT